MPAILESQELDARILGNIDVQFEPLHGLAPALRLMASR